MSMKKLFSVYYSKYIILIPVILAIAVLSIGINKPFIGHHDFVAVFNSNIAMNYLKFGPLALKLGQVSNLIDNVKDISSFYTHYLPLFPLLLALLFHLFGQNEVVARIIPIFFSVVSVVSLYLIVQKLWDFKVAFLASIFFILNPMYIYFGKVVGIEPVIISLLLTSFYFYIRWCDDKKKKDFIICLILAFLGGLFGWQMNYLVGVIFVYSVLTKNLERNFFYILLVLIFTFLLQFIHAFILTGSFIDKDLVNSFKSRVIDSNISFGGKDFNYLSYIKQEISYLQIYYTRILIVLSGVYLLANIRSKFNKQKAVVLSLLVLALGHPIIFSRYVFIHDYLNIYMLPFFALAGALGLVTILKWLQKIGVNKLVLALLTFLIVFMFITERLDYTKALLGSHLDQQGRQMALVLNQVQRSNRDAAIVSTRFNEFYGFYISFYSKYSFDILNPYKLDEAQLGRYHYVIFIDEDINDKEQYEAILSKYQYQKINGWTVVNMRDEKTIR